MATLTTLLSFDGTNGAEPRGSLMADANGDLFGTTGTGRASGEGTVFEIAKTATGYASTPTVLVSFNGTDGASPFGSLIADASGDLFGTTFGGGANGDGTVFEIARTATGYASTPTVLVSFNDADGGYPTSSLIADANGDLFGTTEGGGGISGDGMSVVGTVFEVTRTMTGLRRHADHAVRLQLRSGRPFLCAGDSASAVHSIHRPGSDMQPFR